MRRLVILLLTLTALFSTPPTPKPTFVETAASSGSIYFWIQGPAATYATILFAADHTITLTAEQEAGLQHAVDMLNAPIVAQNAVLAAQVPPGKPLPLLYDSVDDFLQKTTKQTADGNVAAKARAEHEEIAQKFSEANAGTQEAVKSALGIEEKK